MIMLKAGALIDPGRLELVHKPFPPVGRNDALLRITADESANAAAKAKDIASFLASQPQAFKIAMTTPAIAM